MPALHLFERHLETAWPPAQWQDLSVILAVSGGADSVALLRAMQAIKTTGPGRLRVAHFNHRLRGDESDADEQFVSQLCQKMSLELFVGYPETTELQGAGDGLEAAARAARYEFLQQAAEQIGARYLVTAHTADDQVETILHHVLRGTGLAGLAGMPRARPLGPAVTLLRPLVEVRRKDVLDYLESLGQPFRQDTTNSNRQYMRNRIRHELLPMLERDYAPGVGESLLRLGALADDAQRFIESAAEELLERGLLEQSARRVALDCRKLLGSDRHIVREALLAVWRRQGWPLQAMGFAQWNLLADMALADPHATVAAQQVFPGAITAQKRGEQLVLFASEKPS